MPRGETRNPVTIILLTLVTCGIYGIYWFYLVSKEINAALGEERINFVLWILLSLLAGVGTYIMEYQVQEALNEIWVRS